MNNPESYIYLQHYWFFINSVLGGLLVFLMFVQGGQTFLLTLTKDEKEKSVLVNVLGRKWEFTFTTLVTFGGAFFASFPLFYSTSFAGAYWVWMAILFAFIIQAVSYEFRSRPNNFLGKKTYEVFLFINGVVAPILIGTAVATFFTGSMFSLSPMREVTWDGPARGLEAALSIHNVSLGLAVFFLARVNGLLYFLNSIDDNGIVTKVKKSLLPNIALFLVFFLVFIIWMFVRTGFALNPDTGEIFMEKFKYLHNAIQMPLVGIVFLVGVLLVLYGFVMALFLKKEGKAIWFTGLGTVLTVVTLLLLSAFNNTSFYPSTSDLQSSLTIYNSSSSYFTLKVMSYVSIMVPFVLTYIWFAWRAMNKKKMTKEELDTTESHVY